MIQLFEGGAYVLNGTEIIPDSKDAVSVLESRLGEAPSKEEAKKQTIAYGILEAHNTSGNMEKLEIKFDKLTSHDITFVRPYVRPDLCEKVRRHLCAPSSGSNPSVCP